MVNRLPIELKTQLSGTVFHMIEIVSLSSSFVSVERWLSGKRIGQLLLYLTFKLISESF